MKSASTKTLLAGLLLVAVAAGIGWYAARGEAPHRHQPERATTPEGKVYWTCAMHPEVRRDSPGQCPICGMALIEKRELPQAAAASTPADGIVQIDPAMRQNLGLRTARVERGAGTGAVEAVGSVAIDETRLVAVVSRTPGFVETLGVHSVGESVKRGQLIAGIYSPELYAAQQEFALVAGSDPALAAASRRRLALLGLPAAQIDALARGGAPLRQAPVTAPVAGVITELALREGMEATPGMPIARIADLSSVWVLADLPEALGAIAVGAPVQASFAALPGERFEGRVDHVYPALDEATRSLRLRVALANPDGRLRPGMLARLQLAAGGDASAPLLQVPTEAVIRSGRRDVVIVAEGDGRFRPAAVRLGRERGDRIEILEGLAEDAEVVVSGQFLIDSEASLRGLMQRLDAPQSEAHAGHGAPR